MNLLREGYAWAAAIFGAFRDCLGGEPFPPEPENDAHGHERAGGDLCTDDGSGCCGVCKVSLSPCDGCGGVGYHRAGCPCCPWCAAVHSGEHGIGCPQYDANERTMARLPADAPIGFRFTWNGDCAGQPLHEYVLTGWMNGTPQFDTADGFGLRLWSARLEEVAANRLAAHRSRG